MRSGRDDDRRRTPRASAAAGRRRQPRRRIRWQRVALHAFLIAMALVWLFPIAVDALHGAPAVSATRILDGYVSFPQTLNFDNFIIGLERGRAAALLPQHAHHRRSRR